MCLLTPWSMLPHSFSKRFQHFTQKTELLKKARFPIASWDREVINLFHLTTACLRSGVNGRSSSSGHWEGHVRTKSIPPAEPCAELTVKAQQMGAGCDRHF